MAADPRILIVRRDNIGDLVCTTPVFPALRQRFPQARICALVNDYNAEVLSGCADLDAVYVYRKAKHRAPGESRWGVYGDRLRLLRALRRERFDWAVLAGASFAPHALTMARLSGARRIVGYLPPDGRKVAGLDIGIAHDGQRHEVEDVFRLLAPLGVAGSPGPLRIAPDAAMVRAAGERLAALGRRTGKPLLAIHISAREPARRWPVKHFAAFVAAIDPLCNWDIVLLWSPGAPDDPRHPGDDATARALLGLLGARPMLPMPTLRLGELIGVLANCDAVVASDGGAMHVAAGLGKPVLALFENIDYKIRHWYPWSAPHEIAVSPGLAVADIAVAQMTEGFGRLCVRTGIGPA